MTRIDEKSTHHLVTKERSLGADCPWRRRGAFAQDNFDDRTQLPIPVAETVRRSYSVSKVHVLPNLCKVSPADCRK